MPPDEVNNADAAGTSSNADEGCIPSSPAVIITGMNTVADAPPPSSSSLSSYWDAPAEKNLEGKRLSQLDLSSLEHQRATLEENEENAKGDKKEGKWDTENTDTATPTESNSYWDTPAEKGLHGQRLSIMDLTTLATQHPVDDSNNNNKNTSNDNRRNRNSIGAYWDWQGEQFKKTLSNLSLSNLGKGSRSGVGVTASEPEQEENCDNDNSTSGMGPRRPSNNSYWFWRNASMKNLNSSTVSLTALEHAAKDGDTTEPSETLVSPTAPPLPHRNNSNGGGGATQGSYWFWRNNSMKNMSMSTTSLETLDKKARESESNTSAAGAAVVTINNEEKGTGGPITNLQHKMRNSWRKSFQHFSTNSLSKLDEGNTVDATSKKGWRDAFSTGKKLQLDNDDSLGGVSACSYGSAGGGGITF